jgi:hypothetical protein
MYCQPSNYPDIFLTNLDANPTLVSPNADYVLEFAFTKEASYDLEEYKSFLDSAIREFRHSRTYTHYKGYLIGLGMNCCQFHPYIQNNDDTMASLEMHHCMLTIYDIAALIAEHFLNTVGSITEFDLSELLRYEHINNRIPIVMLCKTCHQLYHHKYLYVHPDMIFGKWWELIDRYKMGMTRDIAYKILMYLNKCIGDRFDRQNERNKKLLELRESILDWSNTGFHSR